MIADEMKQRVLARPLEQTMITLPENELWEFCQRVEEFEIEHREAKQLLAKCQPFIAKNPGLRQNVSDFLGASK